MQFNKRETATILAALRCFQANLTRFGLVHMEHFHEVTPLTPEEIDALCERINCDENKIIIVIESGNLQGVYSDTPLHYIEYNIDEDSNEPLLMYEGRADLVKQFHADWDKTLKEL
jgi:hypothetical protein